MTTSTFNGVLAMLRTRQLLVDLQDPAVTPRLTKAVRDQARELLEHYPASVDSAVIARVLARLCDVADAHPGLGSPDGLFRKSIEAMKGHE
jgi:hypothetical protein